MSQYQRAQISNTSVLASERATATANPDRGALAATKKERPGVLASVIKKLTPGLHHLSIQTSKTNNPNGSLTTHFSLVPGPGRHILRYKNTFISVHRERETKALNLQTGAPWETIKLTTLYSQRHIFESLFTEAHKLAMQLQEGKTVIFTAWGTEWRPFGQPRRKRGLDSVVLDRGIKEQILADVEDFLESSQWYFDRGIPYRRGYLLHGPPGSGKSSFIQALAGSLDYNISLLNLSERGLTDDRLNHLLTNVPARTLVLLEDIDAAFTNRRTQKESDGYRGANVTFSGLLNALDGVASAEERLVFLTTNHISRLDPALVRPGRVDMSVHLGYASRYQIERLWDRFYDDPYGRGKRRFLAKLEELGLMPGEGEGRISTAALQGLFLYHKGDVEGAVAGAEGLVGDGGAPAGNDGGGGVAPASTGQRVRNDKPEGGDPYD
jgi:mitochondrial chaperone BCS1